MSADSYAVFKVEGQRVECALPAWSNLVSITCFWFDEFADGQVEHLDRGLLVSYGGKWPRLRVTFRNRALIDSIGFVLYTTRRSSGGNTRNGTTGHADRQVRAIAG
jgi:hypothetical protein